jgi:hypothetical protein
LVDGCTYVHLPELAPTDEMLEELKKIRTLLEPKPAPAAPPAPKGLWAEFMDFLSKYKVLGIPLISIAGVIFGAVYMLWMYQRVFLGTVTNPANADMGDIGSRERFILLPIMLVMLWIGVYSSPILRRMDASLGLVQRRIQQARVPEWVLEEALRPVQAVNWSWSWSWSWSRGRWSSCDWSRGWRRWIGAGVGAGAGDGAGAAAASAGGGRQFIGQVDVFFYKRLFSHAGLIQGFFSGLVAGQMGEGDAIAGIKYSVLIAAIAWVTFRFFI